MLHQFESVGSMKLPELEPDFSVCAIVFRVKIERDVPCILFDVSGLSSKWAGISESESKTFGVGLLLEGDTAPTSKDDKWAMKWELNS